MRTYSLAVAPTGDDYLKLLDIAGEFAVLAGLVQGSPTREPSSAEFMAGAERFLLRDELVYEYPGGITPFPVRRFLYRYDSDFVTLVTSVTSSLFDWSRPRLPEDLHLLRPDESTVLGSVTSEDHAYLRLTDAEAQRWLVRWPASVALQA